MKVDVKDKDPEVIRLDIAMRMVSILSDYKTADLIHKMLKVLKEKGDDLTIMDAAKIRCGWEEKWDKYFKEKKKEKKKPAI